MTVQENPMPEPEEEDFRMPCDQCGSRDTHYIKTHFDINSDNEVSEYRCNACGARFAD